MIQDFINKQFYYLFVFTFIFGVIFYDTIGFNYTDEICSLLLLVLYGYNVFKTKNWEFNKLFLIVLGVFLFYLCYSLYIGSNIKKAIITDFIIQLKPYLGFFCVYSIAPKLSVNQKKIIQQIVLIFVVYLFCIGVLSLAYNEIIHLLLGHTSRYATAVSILGLLYLYCGNYSKSDKFFYLVILALGLFSGRSKFFGFYAISLFMMTYLNNSFKMKLNFKNSVFILFALAAVLFVAREKIVIYFVEGGFGSGGRDSSDFYARMALYYFSIPILLTYFPFGSGFASYATYASGLYYSKIYAKYSMEGMQGLTKANPEFVADTYYPALAQFGIVGILLFFSFWAYLAKLAIKAYIDGFKKESVLALLIIIFFLIECTSDATLTHNRGVFLMMLLGLLYSDIRGRKHVSEIN